MDVRPAIKVVGGVLVLVAAANGAAAMELQAHAAVSLVARFVIFVTSLVVGYLAFLLLLSGLRRILLPLIAALALSLTVMGNVVFSLESLTAGFPPRTLFLGYPQELLLFMTSYGFGVAVLVAAKLSPDFEF